MAETLYATFPSADMAERAVGALFDHGATADCLSLVSDTHHIDGEDPLGLDNGPVDALHGITTTTGGDAAAGAMKGAGIGLGVGALAALASLIIPGFGLVIGGGALALALGAAAATTAAGAIAGGVAGYLIDQGVPDKVALTYQEELAAGRTLLSIALPCGEMDRAQAAVILDKYGATNVGAYPQAQSAPGPLLNPVVHQAAAMEIIELERARHTQPLPVAEQPIPMDVVTNISMPQPIAMGGGGAEAMTRQDAFVQHFEDNYRERGFTYSEVAPAYEFGYIRAMDPRFEDRDWFVIETDLISEWELMHPGTFDTMLMAIRYGWERCRTRLLA